jgi:hypothetical protein
MPVMLIWSKRDQLRFINAVERLQSLVNDLESILAPKKRRLAARVAGELDAQAVKEVAS